MDTPQPTTKPRRTNSPQNRVILAYATDPFLTTADTSYAAGQKAPYTEKLTKRGYSPARLQQLAATIDTLTNAISDQNEAEGQAINTTATRNTAYKVLQSFMRELKGTSKGALRGKPALLAKLRF